MAFSTNYALCGVTSEDTSVPAAGTYFIKGKLQIPRVASGSTAASSVIVTVTNRTGPVTLYTSTAGDFGFYVDTLCAAGDVLRVALTSAASVDTADLNAVKCEVSIGSGV